MPADETNAEDATAGLAPLVIPEDLSALSEDELQAAVDECNERSELLTDEKSLDDVPAAEATGLIENVLAVGEALDAEVAKREEAKAEAEQILADVKARLAKRLNPEDDADEGDEAEADAEPEAGEPEAEGDEDEADATPAERQREPVTAAVKPNRTPRRSKAHEPLTAQPRGPKLLALADLPGKFMAGSDINKAQASELLAERYNRSHAVDGPRMDIPLLRFSIDTPDDRMLVEGDEHGNTAKLDALLGHEALVASGGLCMPPEPLYDFQTLSTAATPVVDSIPRFGATRGSIRWMTPYTIADISTAVGQITAANDALGGTNATKTCQTIPCPEQQTASIDALYHCLGMGNMGARTAPELVSHFTDLMMAVFARLRETKALDALKAGSTQLTQATAGGASPTLLGGILQAAEGIRSRARMADSTVLRAWFPRWVLGELAEDFLRRPYDKMEVLDGNYQAFVTAKMRALQIAPTFYLDSETSGGMVFATQGAAALQDFPATVKWFIAPEGTWIRLDGGTLDLGLVRDSTLNATNDFQMFGEVFEGYAKRGTQAYEITTTTAASGVVKAPA